MIIKCEKCETKFDFDESLLKENGSKVRCSVCKHVFLAYPPVLDTSGQEEIFSAAEDEFEKTIALDSPPALDDVTIGTDKGDGELDFEGLFDEPAEGEDREEVGLFKDIEGEAAGMDEGPFDAVSYTHLTLPTN